MILARTHNRRTRFNTLLVTFIALMAFALGGFVTVGFMKVADFFRGDAPVVVAETATPAPVEEEIADVTRTAPTELLTIAEPEVAVEQIETAALVQQIEPAAATQQIEPIVQVASVRPLARETTPIPEAVTVPAAIVTDALTSEQQLEVLASAITSGQYDFVAEDMGQITRIGLFYRDAEPAAEALRDMIEKTSEAGFLKADFATLADGQGTDAQTLLFEMIDRRLASGAPSEIAAARVLKQAAFAASDARTSFADGKQVYTVRPGDSLAYIALQFYGSTQAAEQIFQANVPLLASPSDLKTGMQLVIPNG